MVMSPGNDPKDKIFLLNFPAQTLGVRTSKFKRRVTLQCLLLVKGVATCVFDYEQLQNDSFMMVWGRDEERCRQVSCVHTLTAVQTRVSMAAEHSSVQP